MSCRHRFFFINISPDTNAIQPASICPCRGYGMGCYRHIYIYIYCNVAHGQHKYTPIYPFGSKKIHSVTKVPSVRNMVSTNTHPYTLLAQKKYTVSLRFPVCTILQCCARSAQIHTHIPFWLKKNTQCH